MIQFPFDTSLQNPQGEPVPGVSGIGCSDCSGVSGS